VLKDPEFEYIKSTGKIKKSGIN